ncbi:MAG: pilus assembly protein PilM [Clostridia bacterium]|nr:pilus assembly protein PilM [Clostridia bacterium]
MQKKQVAVLDVGSSKITAVVGERGINKTFVIKGSFSYEYDGFENGAFFDVESVKKILMTACEDINRACGGAVRTIYVGVPGEFTQVIVKNSQISFDKKKKIQEQDVDDLFDGAFVLSSSKYTLINRSAIVYELDDFRRLANPIGAVSQILKGKLSFIVCTNYFIEAIKPTLKAMGFTTVECVSSMLAEALYLIDAESRDRTAMLIDIGYISSTFSIVRGDGLLFQKSFTYGGGYITAALVEKLSLDFAVAESLKRKVSLSRLSTNTNADIVEGDNGEYYNHNELKQAVILSLDGLCEQINLAIEESGVLVPEYVSLKLTGGGISFIRGAKEHLSSRLGTVVEIVAPKVPLMDKPTESTVLSVMDLALEQN